MLTVRTILCPTDFSERAEAAMELASALARDYKAKLVIAHVTAPPIQGVSEGVVVGLPTGWIEASKAKLESLRPANPNVSFTHMHAVGNEADEILRMAEEAGADLIVMGTHGRTGLSRLLAGSVAESVLRAALCPVLTVRSPFPAPLSVALKAERRKTTVA